MANEKVAEEEAEAILFNLRMEGRPSLSIKLQRIICAITLKLFQMFL